MKEIFSLLSVVGNDSEIQHLLTTENSAFIAKCQSGQLQPQDCYHLKLFKRVRRFQEETNAIEAAINYQLGQDNQIQSDLVECIYEMVNNLLDDQAAGLTTQNKQQFLAALVQLATHYQFNS